MSKQPYEVMDLKALRCFWAMAKHGSLTRGGIELGISEAAVSQRIKSLERYLGTKLYEARGGRVRLTRAGERTMERAVSLFDELTDLERTVADEEESAEITLATHDVILRYLLPDVVTRFTLAHPLARLRLLARRADKCIQLVRTNEADLCIVSRREIGDDLICHDIASYGSCLLLPRGHPLARRAREDYRSVLDEKTVSRYPLIVSEGQHNPGSLLSRTAEQFEFKLNVCMEVTTIDTLKHYVALGLGIAAVSALCIQEEDRTRLEVVDVPPDISAESTYGVVVRRDKHVSGPLQGLLTALGVEGRRGQTGTS